MITEKGYEIPDGVAADLVVLTKKEDGVYVVLIDRAEKPLGLAIPGGHLDRAENFDHCSVREFSEECSVRFDLNKITLLKPYSVIEPRGWYITLVYYLFAEEKELDGLKANDDAKKIVLLKLTDILKDDSSIAFEHHKQILKDVYKLIQSN